VFTSGVVIVDGASSFGVTGAVTADDRAGATGVDGSASGESWVGTDAGRTGTPGGDCTPGTPGNENNSLADGIEVAASGYSVGGTGDGGSVGVAVGLFATRGSAGTSGVTPLTSCEEGATPGASEGTALCTGLGAMVPPTTGATADLDADGEKAALGGGTTVCMPAVLGIAGARGK